MSRVSDKVKDSFDEKIEDNESIPTDEDDTEEAENDDTPDLYRNSSLGLCVPFCVLMFNDCIDTSHRIDLAE